jgi:hypothetical protein
MSKRCSPKKLMKKMTPNSTTYKHNFFNRDENINHEYFEKSE